MSTAAVVDPHPLWLDATERLLRANQVEVIGTSTSLRAAASLIERARPGLLVIEPVDTGDEPFAWIREQGRRWPEMRTIVFSRRDDSGSITAAFASGAAAYVVKKARPVEIGVALRQLNSRSIYLSHDQGLAATNGSSNGTLERAGLPHRERELLALASEGRSNKEMARQLWVTEQTVKFHLSNIYRKLRVQNRTQASRWAYEQGLLAAVRSSPTRSR